MGEFCFFEYQFRIRGNPFLHFRGTTCFRGFSFWLRLLLLFSVAVALKTIRGQKLPGLTLQKGLLHLHWPNWVESNWKKPFLVCFVRTKEEKRLAAIVDLWIVFQSGFDRNWRRKKKKLSHVFVGNLGKRQQKASRHCWLVVNAFYPCLIQLKGAIWLLVRSDFWRPLRVINFLVLVFGCWPKLKDPIWQPFPILHAWFVLH